MPGRKTRSFGSIRKLPSGRWQARYRGPDGLLRPAPHTFAYKADASRWLALAEAELLGGKWTDPDAGRVPFSEYAAAWLDERPGLRPKTLQLYRYLLRVHLQDEFGPRTIASIIEADVRRWRADLLSAGVSPVTAAKAYRLLTGILATTVEDGLIPRNPAESRARRSKSHPNGPPSPSPGLRVRPVGRLRVGTAASCQKRPFCPLSPGETATNREACRRRSVA